MSITINELVALPFLQTRFLAGEKGGDRAILWAHTCELSHPWEWLGTGDLLLSDGLSFPSGADEQVQFIRALAGAALSGLALAEGMQAPPLTAAAMAAADDLCFPILETAYSVPFVTLVRSVADGNSREAGARLGKIIRVYDVLRRQHEGRLHGDSLLADLGRDTGTELHVVDRDTAEPLLPGSNHLLPTVREVLLDAMKAAGRPLPTFVRVTVTDGTLLALPLGPGERGVLVAAPLPRSTSLDLVVLQHLATIAHLEVERREAMALRRTEAGARLLSQLIDGTIDLETAETRMAEMGLRRRPWRAVSIGASDDVRGVDLRSRLRKAEVPHLAVARDDELLALIPEAYANSEILGFGPEPLPVGVSQTIHNLRRIGDGVRQARWAVDAARDQGRGVVVYGEQAPMFMPRTVAEGESVIARVLGPLLRYDDETGSQLVQSLQVFFESNRSWKEAADRLGVHRQTLSYRMHRVEELTGRDLHSLSDQTDLYLALKTRRMLSGTSHGPGRQLG